MTRKCMKCSMEMVVNEKLGYMECISGKHIEPINLNIPQWWNKCPHCDVMGLNYADQEAKLQKFDENNNPVFDNGKVVFTSQVPKPITCRACGKEFVKHG